MRRARDIPAPSDPFLWPWWRWIRGGTPSLARARFNSTSGVFGLQFQQLQDSICAKKAAKAVLH
jgi:hypothetical protein